MYLLRGTLCRAALALPILLSACDPTLPPAAPHANVRPAPPPPPMQICWVEYSTNSQPAGFGVAGSSDHREWEITYSGLLVRHPKGDLLLDAGNSSHFDEEIESAGCLSQIKLR